MQNVFQLNTKQLFLTYPQCNLSKEDALMLLQERLSEYVIDKYVIAHEHHANGDDHLHCYFKLIEPFRTRDAKALDLREFHGNYQGCRSAKNVVKYCTKAEDYLANFDIGDCVNGPSATKVAMQQLLDGVPLPTVVKENPMLLKGYRNLKVDLMLYQEDILPAKPDLPAAIPNPWRIILDSGIEAKRRHFWIYSDEPNLGKTTRFAIPLCQTYRGSIHTGDFQYWDVSRHDEFLIFDDYNTGKLKWDVLNQLCDNTYQFRRCGQGNVKITNSYLIIVLSNTSIERLYPNSFKYLYERFNEIKLD